MASAALLNTSLTFQRVLAQRTFHVVAGHCRLGDRDGLGAKNIKITFAHGVNLIVQKVAIAGNVL